MNGDTRKDIALGAIALGVGVALGAVIGNDKTRSMIRLYSQSLAESGNSWLAKYRKKK